MALDMGTAVIDWQLSVVRRWKPILLNRFSGRKRLILNLRGISHMSKPACSLHTVHKLMQLPSCFISWILLWNSKWVEYGYRTSHISDFVFLLYVLSYRETHSYGSAFAYRTLTYPISLKREHCTSYARFSTWRRLTYKKLYIYMCVCVCVCVGSSVGIATDYELDGPGSNPGGDEIFRPSRPALGPTQPPWKWVLGLSRGWSAVGACCWPLIPF